jgi:mRNA interferase MazF
MTRKRNAEGYYDPTAYLAMRNIEQLERGKQKMGFKRGDIYYVDRSVFTGSEQASGRPAIIVSNEKNNEYSSTVEVVYLTTQPKKDLPTHVVIRSAAKESIAICEQITTVAVERIGSYKGHVTDTEMMNLEIAMLISLDMQVGTVKEKVVEVPVEKVKEVPVPLPMGPDAGLMEKLAAANAKCEVLQAMYDSLLNRVIGKTV